MLNYKMLTVLAFILTSGIFYEDAFADHTTTQPNANVSYDSATKEVQVEWDYTTGPNAPTTCLLKGDFWYHTEINLYHDTSPTQNLDTNHAGYDSLTRVTGFTPIYYSVVSSSPTVVQTVSEVIPCQGSTRIDIDIIMSHPSNVKLDGVTPREDLQIFLSFYSLHEGRDFTFDHIDEIFVFYTPNDTWRTEAKDYACAGQAGNTIYIDQSAKGIHTNSGADCDVYLELDSNQWIDIADDKTQTPGIHVARDFSLLIQVVHQIIVTLVNGGSSDDHNSRPTFGIDYKTFTQLVDEGLVINDKVFVVTDNYWTPMDLLTLEVGVTQNFTSTLFAPHTLKVLEFAFGIPEVGKWNEAEASIEIETNYDGEITDFEINEYTDSTIINATSLEYSSSKVKCNANDNTEPCYRVSIEFSFLESPIGEVLALQAIDNERKNQILYFNDGLDITGESLNPPTVQQISSEIKYKGLQTIQRIDKVNDIWLTLDKSEPVLQYQQNSHGTFIPIEYRITESIPDKIQMNMDRLNSNFNNIIIYEQNRATLTFDSNLIQGEDPTSWSYVYPIGDDRIDADTKQIMKEQEELARIILEAK